MIGKKLDIAQELYARNAELLEFNKILSLIQEIEAAMLIKDRGIASYLDEIVSLIINESEFSLFGLIIFDGGQRLYESFGILNKNDLSFQKIRLEFADDFNPIHLVTDGLVSTDDVKYNADKLLHLDEEDYIVDCSVLTLNSGLKCTMIYGERDNVYTSFQKHLIQRLKEFLGTILENIILNERLKSTSDRLRKSNDKLLALDEAKDEFVSMASHQLRTPLTSVKGYISMVLEGDAGKINDTQKQMLGQALFSSQRMVYLISDLLNVSRLKTGKFIIEAKPVYLPDLIESEVAQLYEGVNSKGLTMEYDKPKSFPKMMLDDMKIRQVVMNFLDNAIYYTPNGGKITVALKENKESIEFTVKDSGIGVPKKEQHKLFAKFYRAENARKARPDGTGLGLFMAKKVIIAQGGSLIFDSKEGKGSTFGFSFPREKLEVKQQQKTD